jgi:hypothetical protein
MTQRQCNPICRRQRFLTFPGTQARSIAPLFALDPPTFGPSRNPASQGKSPAADCTARIDTRPTRFQCRSLFQGRGRQDRSSCPQGSGNRAGSRRQPACTAPWIERGFLGEIGNGPIQIPGVLTDQATHVQGQLVLGIFFDGLRKIRPGRSEEIAGLPSFHYIEPGPQVKHAPATEVEVCMIGGEPNSLLVVLFCQRKEPFVLVIGDEFESSGVARLLSVRVGSIRVADRLLRAALAGFDRLSRLRDIPVATAQIKISRDADATSQGKDAEQEAQGPAAVVPVDEAIAIASFAFPVTGVAAGESMSYGKPRG